MSSASRPNLPEQRFIECLEELLDIVRKAEVSKGFTDAYAKLDPEVHGGKDFRHVVLNDLMDAFIDATWHMNDKEVPLSAYRCVLQKQTGARFTMKETERAFFLRCEDQNDDESVVSMTPQFVKIFGDKPRAELIDVMPQWKKTFLAMLDTLEKEKTLRARNRGERLMERTKNFFDRSFGPDIEGVLQQKKDARTGPYDKRQLNSIWFKAEDMELPAAVMKKIRKDLDRMDSMNETSADYNSMIAPLDTILDLPWNRVKKSNFTMAQIQARLDERHTGLDEVKDIILEQVAVEQRTGKACGKILCLNGAAGVGKSTLAQAVAYALDRPLVRISLGGKRDVTDITGHSSTYVHAQAGRIIDALIEARVKNPVIQLDEIDKLGTNNDGQSDIEAALLEVIDPEQNDTFRDSFINVDFDLGDVTFIATSNNKWNILPALRDRMEMVELAAYSPEEKYQIARDHLLPKKMAESGIKQANLEMEPGLLEYIIENYVREAGVRNLERQIEKICRKVARQLQTNKDDQLAYVSIAKIKDYLGEPKNQSSRLGVTDGVGIVNGLGVSDSLGSILPFEVIKVPRKGGEFQIRRTGQMKDMMKESVDIIASWIEANAKDLKLDLNDVELHVNAIGSMPKDGPSAGIAIATACISALKNEPVRANVAMTGEMTLGGRVLAIGGTLAKIEGAMRDGIEIVMIPEANMKDLSKASAAVRERIHVVPVDTISKVLSIAFVNGQKTLTHTPDKPAEAQDRPRPQLPLLTHNPAPAPAPLN